MAGARRTRTNGSREEMKRRRDKRRRQREAIVEPYVRELERSRVVPSVIKAAKTAMLLLLLGAANKGRKEEIR